MALSHFPSNAALPERYRYPHLPVGHLSKQLEIYEWQLSVNVCHSWSPNSWCIPSLLVFTSVLMPLFPAQQWPLGVNHFAKYMSSTLVTTCKGGRGWVISHDRKSESAPWYFYAYKSYAFLFLDVFSLFCKCCFPFGKFILKVKCWCSAFCMSIVVLKINLESISVVFHHCFCKTWLQRALQCPCLKFVFNMQWDDLFHFEAFGSYFLNHQLWSWGKENVQLAVL